jgi:hypothetical protein
MAETLGSLIDKLIIKEIRLVNLQRMKSAAPVSKSIRVVEEQISQLSLEIDSFLKLACRGKVVLREQKIKLYRNPSSPLQLNRLKRIGPLVELLSQINSDQWVLEDKIREPGIPYKRVAELKRKIDLSNKNRNDTIDRIDELLEQKIHRCRK